MSVYVDDLYPCVPSPRWRWNLACHLWADEIEELHTFAAEIGLKRSWFQHTPGKMPHYDLTERLRDKAIKHGAVALGRRLAVEYWRLAGWVR